MASICVQPAGRGAERGEVALEGWVHHHVEVALQHRPDALPRSVLLEEQRPAATGNAKHVQSIKQGDVLEPSVRLGAQPVRKAAHTPDSFLQR